MASLPRQQLIDGPAGQIDLAIDEPAPGLPSVGKALIAHPHPLFGGTRDNKVVQTLTRSLNSLGYTCWRPNFRGVGKTQGVHDEGRGETDDLLAVIEAMGVKPGNTEPLVLAGFSFGCFVQSRVLARLQEAGIAVERLILIAPAVSRFPLGRVPPDSLIIHGEVDDVVSLSSVIDWARPQILPLVVIPGADHFFHRKLTVIKNLIFQAWGRSDLRVPVAIEE